MENISDYVSKIQRSITPVQINLQQGTSVVTVPKAAQEHGFSAHCRPFSSCHTVSRLAEYVTRASTPGGRIKGDTGDFKGVNLLTIMLSPM